MPVTSSGTVPIWGRITAWWFYTVTSFQIAETELHQRMDTLQLSRKCHHILHWNLVAPSLQSRISMQAANACFTQMNILLPSFNSDSVRTETMDSDVEPIFFVAYSSVSLSTHIRMLLELSSFANEFFKHTVIIFGRLEMPPRSPSAKRVQAFDCRKSCIF